MDFQAAVDYILSYADYERISRSAIVFDLRRMDLLLERLGNPQDYAKSVHITGTKGKGSTSAMIASILTNAGYRTGLYTSPHLLSIRERIQIDGQPIPEDAWARLTETLQPEVETVNKVGAYGQLTTFELLTALAFLYYRENQVDYQVLEVGLGGRLDATNVIKKAVCAITSISYDHMDVLGHTLMEIATEKAGIIKPGCTVVSSHQKPEAMSVIEKVCCERGVRLIRVGQDVTWQRQAFSPEGQSLVVNGLKVKYDLHIPLVGEHQLENTATAVAVAEVLVEGGAKISPEDIVGGVAKVDWPGRLQILRRQPWLLVDGAHNADSARRLMLALREYFPFERLFLIIGASSDKDISGILAELVAIPGTVIATQAHHPRALPPERLAAEFAKCGVKAETAASSDAALEFALAQARPNDLICATGSLFIVAEVMEYMGKQPERE